jgi:hypothetical protein
LFWCAGMPQGCQANETKNDRLRAADFAFAEAEPFWSIRYANEPRWDHINYQGVTEM